MAGAFVIAEGTAAPALERIFGYENWRHTVKKVFRVISRIFLALFILALVSVFLFYFLRWRGLILLPQETNPAQWEIFGVDVSTYQGQVDWASLAEQGVDFAFLKATEGSSLQDSRFTDNWKNARDAGVRVGAYHFFSYDSPGETQAENFISTVPVQPDALPPVVDIEFYGDKLQNLPQKAETREILDPLLSALEEHYGVKPILYVTDRSYRLYIHGAYEDYPLWVSRPAVAPLEKDWTFWQYSHSARMEGYEGSQELIDLNVFRGSAEAFERFGFAQ